MKRDIRDIFFDPSSICVIGRDRKETPTMLRYSQINNSLFAINQKLIKTFECRIVPIIGKITSDGNIDLQKEHKFAGIDISLSMQPQHALTFDDDGELFTKKCLYIEKGDSEDKLTIAVYRASVAWDDIIIVYNGDSYKQVILQSIGAATEKGTARRYCNIKKGDELYDLYIIIDTEEAYCVKNSSGERVDLIKI